MFITTGISSLLIIGLGVNRPLLNRKSNLFIRTQNKKPTKGFLFPLSVQICFIHFVLLLLFTSHSLSCWILLYFLFCIWLN